MRLVMGEIEILRAEIEQLKQRVYVLEHRNDSSLTEVEENKGQRDTTRYLFLNGVYSKNKLVLAVVKQYIIDKGIKTFDELICAFPKSLQGSKGVVARFNDVRNILDYGKRYFCKEEQIVHLDCDVVVCTQWGIFNIGNFIACAKQLGYSIELVK